MGQQDGLAYGVVGRNTYVPIAMKSSGRNGGLDIPNIKPDKQSSKQQPKGSEFSPKLIMPELGMAKDIDIEMMPLDYQYYNTLNNHLEATKFQAYNYISYAHEAGILANEDVQSQIKNMFGDIAIKANEMGVFMQKAKEFKDNYKADYDYFRDNKQGASAIGMHAMTSDGDLIYYVSGKGYVTESEVKDKSTAFKVTVGDYLREYKSGYLNSAGGRKREYMPLFHYDTQSFLNTIDETIKSDSFKNFMGTMENSRAKGIVNTDNIRDAAYEYLANSLNITPITMSVEVDGKEETGAAYTRNFVNANNFNIVKAINESSGEFMDVKNVHSTLDIFAKQKVENTYNLTFARPTREQAIGSGGLTNFITNNPEFLEPVKTSDTVTVELYRPRDYQSKYSTYRQHTTEGLELMKTDYPKFKKIIEDQAKYQYLSVDYESLENDAKLNLYLNYIFRTKYNLGNKYVMDSRKYNKVKYGYALNDADMDNMTIYKNPSLSRHVVIGGALNSLSINMKDEDGEIINSPVIMLKSAPTGYPYITKTEDGNAMVSSFLLVKKDVLKTMRILRNGSPALIDKDDYASLGIVEVKPGDPQQSKLIYSSIGIDPASKQGDKQRYNFNDYYIVPADVLYKKTEIMTDLQQTESGRQSLRIK